jgi:hypothetical protein
MSEFDLVFISKIEQDYAFASTEIHTLHFEWREHALDHQTNNFHRVIIRSGGETVHDEQRRSLQSCTEYF